MYSPDSDSQVERALDNMPQAPAKPPGPDDPQTPFPTSLVLTRMQEEALVNHVMDRLTTLEYELGRVVAPQGTVPVPDPRTWMGRRQIWTLRYYNHVQDRARKGSIYEHSNLTANLAQRITMQMVARANNFFFASEPWFTCRPTNSGAEGDARKELEDRIDRHLHWKFHEAHLVRTLEKANEFAFVRGEAITKTTYVIKQQRYKKHGNALVVGGQLYPDQDGNPIFDDAQWIPEIAMSQPDPSLPPDQQQPPQMIPTGRQLLKSDGVTVQPPDPTYQAGLWPCHVVTQEGADCALVYFQDFLCPLDAPTVHDADINIHLYSMPVMRLVEMFARDDLRQAGVKDLETLQKAVTMIRQLNGDSTQPLSAADQPRGDHGEHGNTAPNNSPDTAVVEAWVLFDVDGDGVQEEVMVAIDRTTRFPIFYDYTANVTNEGRRPFECVRPREVDGRWWGIGAMEYFEPEQEFIDLLINRRNFRMSQAGRVTFWAPWMTLEGRAQPKLTLGFGKTYTLAEGYKAEEALAFIELPDDSENLMELLNFYMQLMQLKSGVINAGDQEASGIPASNTATGVNDVAKSGQEMFAQYLSCLQIGQTDTLIANVLTTYRNLNKPEIFRYFQGDTAGLDSIQPEEVRHLHFIITILLTRQKTEQALQTSQQASNLVKDFYAQPPVIQSNVADFYREGVSALGYNNSKRVINPAPVSNAAPTGDPNAQGAIGAAQAGANSAPNADATGAPPALPAPSDQASAQPAPSAI